MNKEKKSSREEDMARLRSAAEELLQSQTISKTARGKGLDEIFQEMQVLRIELEMQNDELQIANEGLELQRLRFANIYDLAPLGYFILNRSGLINEANEAASQLFGTGRDDIIGKLFTRFVARESAEIFYIFFDDLLSSGKKSGCNLRLIGKGGARFHARLEGRYVAQTYQCYLAVLDISESINSRQQLAEVNERLQLAMEASRAGTWELDPETMAFKFDEFGYHFCNMDEAQFGRDYSSFLHLIHPDDHAMVDYQFRTAFRSAEKLDLVCRLVTPGNQPCFVALRGHMLRRADGQQMLIGIIMDYTEKKQLEVEAERLHSEHQKEVSAAVMSAEESERKRMSEALHDSVGQLLYGVKLQVSQMNASGQPELTKQVNELLDRAIRETRNLSFELSPAILVDFGLKDAVEELIRRLSTPDFLITSQITGLGRRLDLAMETHIYRIVQELINNCMKHAQATTVQVSISKHKNLTIEVTDNGCGFSVTRLEHKPKGAGFSSIRNRVSVYNGRMHIDSHPGKGTSVKVQLSL